MLSYLLMYRHDDGESEDELYVYECDTCHALVDADKMRLHEEWHSELDYRVYLIESDVQDLQKGHRQSQRVPGPPATPPRPAPQTYDYSEQLPDHAVLPVYVIAGVIWVLIICVVLSFW